jgi:hypothetical protein
MEPQNRPLPALLRRALRDSVPVMAGYPMPGILIGTATYMLLVQAVW